MASALARFAAAVLAVVSLGCAALAPSSAAAQSTPSQSAPTQIAPTQTAPVRKLALVIGNAEYDGNVLDNPEHDAAAVGARLTALGFAVTNGMNMGRAGMGSLIAQFVDGVADGDLVLIFYAGHGVEVGGQTYLIPVDARMLSPSAPRFEGVPVEQLWSFGKRPYGTVILFDACRDSPFLSRVRGDVAGGHAASTPPNTLVLFSSSAGRPASDGVAGGGATGHSLFTAALLDALKAPDTSLDQVVRNTTRAVRSVSGDSQVPQRYGGLDQDFAFAGAAPALVLAAAPPAVVEPAKPAPPPAVQAVAQDLPRPAPEPAPIQIAVASTPTTLRSIPAGTPSLAPVPTAPAPLAAASTPPAGRGPAPPVLRGLRLETVAQIDVPASFCSVEEKYAFIANRQKPAGEAAMRNNAEAIAYKAELNALYVKYRDATPGGTYSGDVMAELKRVGTAADEAFARAAQTQHLFDVIMAVPVSGRCRA